MKTQKFLAIASICIGAVSVGQGQTTIVDATGATPGSVTTIAAALAGSDPEIIVKNTGVYQEGLLITRDVNLHGEDPNNRPIIAMTALPTQPTLGTGDGIYIGGPTGGSGDLTITFKDFIVIPATSNGPTDDAFSVTSNPGATLHLNITNVLCAPNNGSDQPFATSVWDDVDLNTAGIVTIPDDGIYLMDEDFGGFDGDIQANLTDFTMIGVGGDAFVLYPGNNGNGFLNGSGVNSSYAGRYAIQASDKNPMTFTGTKDHPSMVMRKNFIGPIFFQNGDLSIDNLVSVDNGDVGLRTDADAVTTLTLTNSLLANNGTQGIVISFFPDPALVKSWTISDCTFFSNDVKNNGLASIQVSSDTVADLTLVVNNSVFAGIEAEGIQNQGAATVIANNCAFVTAGLHALPGSNTNVTENNTINDDPVFTSIATNPLDSGSFDVTAAAYATASSTSGELNGWGEGPSSSVHDWSMY